MVALATKGSRSTNVIRGYSSGKAKQKSL
jgi:hypothetical protein